MCRRFIVVAFAFFAYTSLIQAQTPGLTFSGGTQISTDNATNPHAESFLAVNPKDPRNMLATAIVIENGKNAAYPYVTRDGGKTWHRGKLKSGDGKVFEGGDPIVYFDYEGNAFFGAIQGTPIGWLLSRSTDGGETWDPPVTVPGGTYDREYMAFDKTGGKFNGRMYAGGCISVAEANGKRHNTIDLVYSEDQGRTFSSGKLLSSIHGDEEMFVMSDLLVSSDGKLIIPFSTYAVRTPEQRQQNPDAGAQGHLWTAVSEDGGVSFLPATKGPSRDRGPGFQALISDAAPRAAIDASSGPYRDRIYLTWANFEGKKYVVKVSHSSDLGKTWSSPVVVNDNTNDADPANPAIAVNKEGVVAVIFNDRRDEAKSTCYRLYAAISLDGGETFSPNVKASEKATCPLAAGNWGLIANSFLDMPLDLSTEKRRPAVAMTAIPSRWPNGGDTQGLDADSNGVFHAAWINGETGVMQIWSKDFVVDRKAALQSALSEPRKDLSRDLTLDVSVPQLDFQKHTLAMKVQLEDKLPVAFEGPFTIVLDDVQTSLKDLRAANAENKMQHRGASWSFPKTHSLASKQKSEEQEVLFEFSGGPPEQPSEIFRAHFKVLGPAPQSATKAGK